MKLKQLSSVLAAAVIKGSGDVEITGIETDSRQVKAGDLFICLPGHTVDGHQFAAQAADQGAAALVVERKLEVDLPQVIVKDSRFAMAGLANAFLISQAPA